MGIFLPKKDLGATCLSSMKLQMLSGLQLLLIFSYVVVPYYFTI